LDFEEEIAICAPFYLVPHQSFFIANKKGISSSLPFKKA